LVFCLGQGEEFLSDFFQECGKGHGLMDESNRAGLNLRGPQSFGSIDWHWRLSW
jgi:hypothetical protein